MEVIERIIAALIVALFLCLTTVKAIGIMQQSGYQNKVFWRWLKRKDNLFYNRISVLALCLALATAVVSLCFSFLGTEWAVILSAVPFFLLLGVFLWSDRKYALKVESVRTGRWIRLAGVYYFLVATFSYILIAVLGFLAELNGSKLYALIAYVPVAVLPLTFPALLCLANAITGVFENTRNRRFIKRAGQVLNEREILRVGIVGSYGKTSVKNILKTLLSEKFTVVETPASYNTPMGIAKTVFSAEFDKKQVFIAEMGARKKGDIQELCDLVSPDYAIFTGVCAQHILSFGSIEEILQEKSKIIPATKKSVVCGNGLQGKVAGKNIRFATAYDNVRIESDRTAFTLTIDEECFAVDTALLGRSAAENISMAATLCLEMGMTATEIAAGIAKLQPITHRLQRLENGGVYILDDGYNCNIEGAKVALEVLKKHEGRTCVVTPGIVEGGILEEELNRRLGELFIGLDSVILVGDTLIGAVKTGYAEAGGDMEKLTVVHTLTEAQETLRAWLQVGDCVLFLNDLPDVW